MMRGKYWVIGVAIPLILAAGETVYWRVAAEQLRTGYQAWLAEQASHGWDVRSAPVSIGGWPRSAAITVPTLALGHAGPTIPGDLSVASAGVMVSVSLFNPGVLRVSLTGPVHVRAADLPDVIIGGDENLISLPLQAAGPSSVSIYGRGLRLEAAGGGWRVTVGLLTAQAQISGESPRNQSQPAATFSLSSEAIALPGEMKWPLGPNIASVSLDGGVSGPLPDTRDIRHWAEAWRDGGGSLEITHLTMGWGSLGLTSSATLALDDQLQPMGSGNGHIVGYAETLDRLAAGGLLTKSAATAAKAVLSLMAGTSDTDEPSSVDVPLTLQYRTLSMRQVPLVRLPELDWPSR
jgi:hypothetical protein